MMNRAAQERLDAVLDTWIVSRPDAPMSLASLEPYRYVPSRLLVNGGSYEEDGPEASESHDHPLPERIEVIGRPALSRDLVLLGVDLGTQDALFGGHQRGGRYQTLDRVPSADLTPRSRTIIWDALFVLHITDALRITGPLSPPPVRERATIRAAATQRIW